MTVYGIVHCLARSDGFWCFGSAPMIRSQQRRGKKAWRSKRLAHLVRCSSHRFRTGRRIGSPARSKNFLPSWKMPAATPMATTTTNIRRPPREISDEIVLVLRRSVHAFGSHRWPTGCGFTTPIMVLPVTFSSLLHVLWLPASTASLSRVGWRSCCTMPISHPLSRPRSSPCSPTLLHSSSFPMMSVRRSKAGIASATCIMTIRKPPPMINRPFRLSERIEAMAAGSCSSQSHPHRRVVRSPRARSDGQERVDPDYQGRFDERNQKRVGRWSSGRTVSIGYTRRLSRV